MDRYTTQQEPLRLANVTLKQFPDDTTLALTPSGRLYQIQSNPETMAQFLQEFDGEKSTADILGNTPDPDAYAEVIQVLQTGGVLRVNGKHIPDEDDWLRFQVDAFDAQQLAATSLILTGDESLTTLVDDSQLTCRFKDVQVLPPAALSQANLTDSHLIMALRQTFDHAFLMELNDFCASRCVRWTQLHFDQGRAWIGPSVTPGSSPDYEDLMGRRLAVAEDTAVFKAITAPTLYGQNYLPPPTELIWALSLLLADVERWVVGVPAYTVGNEVEADPLTFALTLHPILPLPHKQLDGKTPVNYFKSGQDLLFDERTGLITHLRRINHHPAIPASLTTVQSHVADMRRLYPWANNTVCSGSTFGDYETACKSAVGEGIERYCGNWAQSVELVKASYHQLRARGEHAVDPESLVLYSQNQYETPGFPFIPFTRDLEVYWVAGRSLTADSPAWIPASIVYVNWYTGQNAGEPPTNFMFYPGIAAGMNLAHALVSGIEEIVERHATMVWWTNAQPLPVLTLPPQLASLWEGEPRAAGQRAWMIHLDNEFGIPVMAGFVENTNEQLFNVGFAARPDPTQAALKAWTEALTLQDGSRDLLDPNGLFQQAVDSGQLEGSFMKPWREDRLYLEDYREDLRDVRDLMCQQQLYLDPRAPDFVRPWVDLPPTRPFDDLPRLQDRSLPTYRQAIETRGHEIFYVDVTTPDVALTGMKVVRVVVPGLVPNFPAAFPFLGHGKIQQTAVALGWRNRPLPEDELNFFPLPHA